MSVVGYVEVENFRSLRRIEMNGLDDYVPIIGLNSSGKSNVLRALNLFFNAYLDEERTPLNMGDDYSSYAPKGKKKVVAITVGLNLNSDFKVRGQKEFYEENGIQDKIYIRRSWQLGDDKLSTVELLSFGRSLEEMVEATAENAASVLAHIRAVRFVYVPNHARPAELIRRELEPLRSSLVSRLRSTKAYREASVDELFSEMRAMGERMFGDVSTAVSRGMPGVGIEPDLPVDFADLLFNIGLRATTAGQGARLPEFEGSGAQSLLLLHVLNLADRTHRGTGFGWVQASIWAVEEPESFLHAGLKIRFAEDLREYAADGKRQVFVTTHQDEFVRIAETAWLAKKQPDTSIAPMETRKALIESAKLAISSYRHPLLSYPTDPIVIVEGKFDAVYLRSAIESANLKPRWRLISPEEAFGPDFTGDAIHQYLKYNKQVIASRADAAPVIVLRDWEATDNSKYDTVLKVHPHSKCIVATAGRANPELGESFKGIERFLPTEYVTSVIDVLTLGRETGEANSPYSIKKQLLEQSKPALGAMAANGQPVGPYMEDLVGWVDAQVVEVLAEVPSSAFL
ncbi:AAA family ATPase [Mycolicibacterium fortuitum]|uniref:AAA family ATPase n=1 Tax=Mycolicibacterium fortuitum TaxID=1766 RepID=UPI0007EBBDEF|nr:AAA family ATPase [Mycolicibacterium fortuitum]OBG42981.1 hypothetical protein A5670_01095 [Mycolicibacterium fortuitum]